MRQGTAKGSLQLFGIIVAGTSLFGFLKGYAIGETLVAAFILSAFVVTAFVVGIAWAGARLDRQLNRKPDGGA